jgi:hypothetical protein
MGIFNFIFMIDPDQKNQYALLFYHIVHINFSSIRFRSAVTHGEFSRIGVADI